VRTNLLRKERLLIKLGENWINPRHIVHMTVVEPTSDGGGKFTIFFVTGREFAVRMTELAQAVYEQGLIVKSLGGKP